MTVFDESASIRAPVNLVWQEAYKLARKGRIEREEVNKILFASHLKLGYVYLMTEDSDGYTHLRHVIDLASKVRKAFEMDQDPSQALGLLDSITETPGREKAKKASGILQKILAFTVFAEAGELVDSSYLRDTGKAQLSRIKKKSERAAKRKRT